MCGRIFSTYVRISLRTWAGGRPHDRGRREGEARVSDSTRDSKKSAKGKGRIRLIY